MIGQTSWPSRSHQPSARLRMSLSDLGGEFNAATTLPDQLPSTAIVGGGSNRNKSKFPFHSSNRERSQDEIFEL